MLFELFDSFLTGLADTIEVGPIGMLTSPMPEIEADVRRITGPSVRDALTPWNPPYSEDKKEDKSKDDKDGIEEMKNSVKIWNTSMDGSVERVKELIENINDIFSAKSDRVNLGLIYDRHQLNDYGKVILDTVGVNDYRSVAGLNTEEQM